MWKARKIKGRYVCEQACVFARVKSSSLWEDAGGLGEDWGGGAYCLYNQGAGCRSLPYRDLSQRRETLAAPQGLASSWVQLGGEGGWPLVRKFCAPNCMGLSGTQVSRVSAAEVGIIDRSNRCDHSWKRAWCCQMWGGETSRSCWREC